MGGQQLPINLSGLVVAAMLIVAALLNQAPLQSQRPPMADIKPEPSGPYEDVPARIWEDPFEAVKKRTEGADGKANNTRLDCAKGALGLDKTRTGQLVSERCGAADNVLRDYLDYLGRDASDDALGDEPSARLLIMPVMVSGAPNGAAREQRLRRRAAVHAGLFQRDFRPLRGDRIGVWTWQALPVTGAPVELDVPFEVFKKDAGRRLYVALLWLNDEAITRDYGREGPAAGSESGRKGPLVMLDRLLGDLGYPVQQRYAPRNYPGFISSAIRVIGPASSDSLEAVYAEIYGSGGPCACCCVKAGRHDCVYQHLDNSLGDAGRAADEALPPAGDGDDKATGLDPWVDDPVNFVLISPYATAPGKNLVNFDVPDGPLPIRPSPGNAGKGMPACGSVRLYRTLLTDDRIISGLVDELAWRGVDPTRREGGYLDTLPRVLTGRSFVPQGDGVSASSRDHVVLISEWDTKFGRTLPGLFTDEVKRRWCERRAAEASEQELDAGTIRSRCEEALDGGPPWIHSFAYMRGLDGDTATSPASAAARFGASSGGKPDLWAYAAGNETTFKEPAIGTNQFDYLRRLTQQIADLDWSLQRSNTGAIRAFGILGNDYFDKLLILQALKERFPSHLYFTTDLDAGLLDDRVFRSTRNLIVASPFDLTLRRVFETGPDAAPNPNGVYQSNFPPFRHSIQTSSYISVLATLDGKEAMLARAARQGRPMLFEVGQDRFFVLRQPGWAPNAAESEEGPYDKFSALQPNPWRSGVTKFIGTRAVKLYVAVLVGLLLLWFILPSVRLRWRAGWERHRMAWQGAQHRAEAMRPPAPASGRAGFWRGAVRASTRSLVLSVTSHPMIAASVVYLVIAAFYLYPVIERGLEPFTLFSGISIWPSEIIRLGAGLVGCLCLVYGWDQISKGDQQIAARFGLGDPSRCQARTGYPAWYAGGDAKREPETIAARACKLFRNAPEETARLGNDKDSDQVRPVAADGAANRSESKSLPASSIWQGYCSYATLGSRLARVALAAGAFWLLSLLIVYGLAEPASPQRGEASYWFSFINGWVFAGLPFMLLLFAALDEALLCSALLRWFEDRRVHWSLEDVRDCGLEAKTSTTRAAIDNWVTTEFIAQRTAPAAQVIHLPFVVMLFLLLSLSTRFDNWNTPASVVLLLVVAIAIAVLASLRLRGTAHRIRRAVLDDLDEQITGIEYAAAKTDSDRLRRLLQRIEKIDAGAYTQWYREPVFRALGWVLAIGVVVISEYGVVGR